MVSVKIGGRRLKVALFRRNVNKTLLHIPHSHLSFFHIRDSRCLYIIIYIYIYINLKLRLRLPHPSSYSDFEEESMRILFLKSGSSILMDKQDTNGRPRQVMQLSQLCINCFELFVVVFFVAHRILQMRRRHIISNHITSHQNHLIILSYHITTYPISHLIIPYFYHYANNIKY
jgi:hypothetical protein